jgi:hypothetical protein
MLTIIPMLKVANDVLEAALIGYQQRANEIEAKIAELRRQIGSPTETATGRRRRRLSVEARQKIAAAQRRRWAKAKGQAAPKSAPKKRHLSAAARKRIAAAQKKRWAELRAKRTAATA